MAWADYINQYLTSGGSAAPAQQGMPSGSPYAPGSTMDRFLANKNALDSAMLNMDGGIARTQRTPFSMSGGTENLYNSWKRANILDQLAIEAEKGGEWWSQLPAQIAGALGGEEAKKDWTFDASKFNLFNGVDAEDLTTARNFVASIPGMIPGGILEGLGDLYEGATGRPINEYRQASTGGYELPDYTMDASQRAGDIVDAGINLLGTFTGGAGRLVGGLGKAGLRATSSAAEKAYSAALKRGATQDELNEILAKGTSDFVENYNKTLRRQEMLEGLSKGVVTRALEGSGKKDLGTALGIMADAGDEAAEEFIQSYAEDVRNKTVNDGSLERAVTGAAWGAVGGGLMGGGGRLLSNINSFAQKKNESSSEAGTRDEGEPAYTERNSQLGSLRYLNIDNALLPKAGTEYIQESYRQKQKAPASFTTLMTGTDVTLGTRGLALGEEEIKSSFYQDDKSAEVTANLFGMTVQEMNALFRSGQNVAEELTRRLETSKRRQVVVGRNPDTKNGGYYMNLVRIERGSAFKTHPALASFVGSDWDGDRASVYLDPNRLVDESEDPDTVMHLDVYGYIDEALLSFEGARSNIDWAFGGFDNNTKLNESQIRQDMSRILADGGYGNRPTIITNFIESLQSAIANKDSDTRNYQISQALANLGEEIEKIRGKQTNLKSGGNIINEVVSIVLTNEEAAAKHAVESFIETTAEHIESLSGLESDKKEEIIKDLKTKTMREWQARGTTGGATRIFQVAKNYGLITYLLDPSSKYNPIYRQYGLLRYATNSVPGYADISQALSEVFGTESVADALIRSAFRLADPNTSPMNAIEGMVDKLAGADISRKSGFPGKALRTTEDVENFISTIKEVQKKYAEIYNEIQKDMTADGFEAPPGAMYQRPIVSLESDSQESQIRRYITRLYGDTNLLQIIDSTILEKLELLDGNGQCHYSLEDILERYSKYEYKYNINLKLQPLSGTEYGKVADLLKGLVRGYESEKSAVASNIEGLFKNIKLGGVRRRFIENGHHLDSRDIDVVMELFEAFYNLVGAENCIAVRFVITDEFFDTIPGQKMLEGDPDELVNLAASVSLYSQYINLIESLGSDNSTVRNNAIEEIRMLGEISPVHNVISDALIRDPSNINREPFDVLTDLDYDIKSKATDFESIAGIKFTRSDFLLSCFQNEVGKFAISSVSAKLRKSQSALTRLQKRIIDEVQSEVDNTFAKIEGVGPASGRQETFVRYVKDRARNAITSYDDALISMKILASLTFNNNFVEKATVGQIFSALYNANAIGVNGGLFSELSTIVSFEAGSMDVDDWINNRYHIMRCLTDPEYSCEVFDPLQGCRVIMTQERLIKSVVPNSSGELDYTTLKAILQKYPHIAGWICEPTTNIAVLNGELGVQQARVRGLSEDFEEWARPYTTTRDKATTRDSAVEKEVDNIIRKIRTWMFNSPDMQHLITMSIDPHILEGHIDERALTKAVRDKMDQWSYYLLWRVANASTTGQSIITDDTLTHEVNSKIIDATTQDLINGVQYALNVELASLSKGTGEAMETALGKDALTAFVLSNVFDERTMRDIRDYYGSKINDSVSEFVKEMTASTNRLIRLMLFATNAKVSEAGTYFSKFILGTNDIDNLVTIYTTWNKGVTEEKARRKIIEGVEKAIFGDFDLSVLDPDSLFLDENDQSFFEDGTTDKEKAESLRKKLSEKISWTKFADKQIDNVIKDCFPSLAGLSPKELAERSEKKNLELARKNALHSVNLTIADHELSEISRKVHTGFNTNAFQLMEQSIEKIEHVKKALTSDLFNIEGSAFDSSFTSNGSILEAELNARNVSYKVPPRLYHTSPITQASISNQMANDSAAGNPTKVGVNGGEGKVVYPFGHLPQSRFEMQYAYAVEKPKAEINDDWIGKHIGESVIGPEGKPIPIEMSPEFRQFIGNLPDGAAIQWFDPDENPHGLPTLNSTPAAHDEKNRYHRISGIFERLVDFSQEEEVLKTKKLLRVSDDICRMLKIINKSGGHRLESANIPGSKMITRFKAYRSAFIDHLTDEFASDRMKGFEFGRDQARLMAQFLTPGMKIEVRNNETGATEFFVLDATNMMGVDAEAKTDAYMASILSGEISGDGVARTLVAAEVLAVTPLEVSYRIMDAINAERTRSGEINTERAEDASFRAINNWRNYASSLDGDIDLVLGRITPLSYAKNSFVRAEDNPSKVQWLADVVFRGAFGITGHQRSENREYRTYDRIKDGEAPIDLAKQFFNKATDKDKYNADSYTILQVFAEEDLGSSESEKLRDLSREWKTRPGNDFNNKYNYAKVSRGRAAAICLDPEAITTTLQWARGTNGVVFVPSTWQDQVVALCHWDCIVGRLKVDGVDMIEVNPNRWNRYWVEKQKMPTTSMVLRPVDQIRSCAILSSSQRAWGDAQIGAYGKTWTSKIYNTDSKVYEMDDIFPATFGRKFFLKKGDAEELLRKIAHQNPNTGYWEPETDGQKWTDAGFDLTMPHLRNNTHIGKNDSQVSEIRDLIVSFLVDMIPTENDQVEGRDDAIALDGAKHNTVAAIVTDGSERYAPVIFPVDLPSVVQNIRVYMDETNAVCMDYAGYTYMFPLDGSSASQKWQLDGETFKGMVAKLVNAANEALSSPKLDADGNIRLDFIAAEETEKSRVGGMDEKLLARSCYYRMRMEDLNLFYRKNEKGNYVPKDFVLEWKTSHPEIYNEFITKRMLGPDFWMKIVNDATIKIGDGDVDQAAIKDAIRACVRYKADPRMLFGSYRLGPVLEEDGSVKTNDNGDPILVRWDFAPSDTYGQCFMELDWEMILQDIIPNPDDLLKCFYAVDSKLCQNGFGDTRKREEYYIDSLGRTLVWKEENSGINFGDGEYDLFYVRYGFHQILGETTQELDPAGGASIAGQHIGRRAGDVGYSPRNLDRGIAFNNIAMGNYSDAILQIQARRQTKLAKNQDYRKPQVTRDDFAIESVIQTGSYRQMKKMERISTILKKTFGTTRTILTSSKDENGNRIPYRNGQPNSPLTAAIQSWNQYIKSQGGHSWTLGMLDDLAKCYTASSNPGSGDFTVTEEQLAKTIDAMLSNLKAGKLPVTVENLKGKGSDSRFRAPLMPHEIAIWVWNSDASLQERYHNDFQEMVRDMTAEMDKAEEALSVLPENDPKTAAKKYAITDMYRALRLEWNQTATILPVWEDFFPSEIKKDYGRLGQAFSSALGWSQETKAVYDQLCEMSEKQLEAISQYVENKYVENIKIDRGNGSESVSYRKAQMARDLASILNNAAELSKVMALASPMVTAGNLVDRVSHQGMARLWLWMGQKLRLGPYAQDPNKIVAKSIREKAVREEAAIRIYQSYRQMEFRSDEKALLMELIEQGNFEAIIEFLNNRKSELSKFDRACEWIYSFGTGFDVGIESQMGLAIDRFAMFAASEGQTWWFEPSKYKDQETGKTLNNLEAMLAAPNGFAKFMLYCLGAEGIDQAPSYSAWMKAMNWAKMGDLAQQNALGLVLSDICSKIPLANVFVTTMVSKFPAYGLNVTGRALNYLLPISSMNYVFTKMLAKTKKGQELGVEQTQIHESLQQAMLIDICKMGIGGVALVLFGISGALQPPDDEDKWGNVNEWLLFGSRASANWWIEDVLGMALPMACFWKTCELGMPRFDLLLNGIKSTCYANPLMRTTDLAEWILNPAESLVTDYTQDFKEFQDAKGGPPEWGQWFQANAFNGVANYMLQFVTPSVMKDLYQASQPMEKSVKRVYQTSASGRETEEGVYGATERTTYADAQIRRLAKRNPVFAFAWSLLSGKSYWAADMPDTVYYDDYQLAGANANSVVGLEGAEKDAKIFEIIATLQASNNMEDLASNGFFLDSETARAVANQIWANYHAWDEWYNDLKVSGQLNYYSLGNGDYDTGKQRANEIYAEKEKWKQFWYNFYYNKLKNSPVLGKMQVYNRYNTTYATDVNGDVYATGIRRFPYNVLPMNMAPGTINSAEGTAGYSNDFMTVSAVTGEPLSNRALIPRELDVIDLPEFDDLAGGDNGASSSSAGTPSGQASIPTNTSTTIPRLNSSGGRSGGGGGGGSYGGGSAPNFYAPSVDIPKTNVSRIMNGDNLRRPQFDYLRPDFETKGSREAYKRSDI